MSLPSRERVLKRYFAVYQNKPTFVAPFAGACVETVAYIQGVANTYVAPFAGVCVETIMIFRAWATSACRSLRGSVC